MPQQTTIDVTDELSQLYKASMGREPYFLSAYDGLAIARAEKVIREQRDMIRKIREANRDLWNVVVQPAGEVPGADLHSVHLGLLSTHQIREAAVHQVHAVIAERSRVAPAGPLDDWPGLDSHEAGRREGRQD